MKVKKLLTDYQHRNYMIRVLTNRRSVLVIPNLLNPVAYQNPRVVYDILFKAAADTLSELSVDKEYLGAQTGFTGTLHTLGTFFVPDFR
jgi:hypothetical protein